MENKDSKPLLSTAQIYLIGIVIGAVAWILFGDKSSDNKAVIQKFTEHKNTCPTAVIEVRPVDSTDTTVSGTVNNKGYLKGDGSPSRPKKYKE